MFRRPLVLVVALMLPVLAAAAGPREDPDSPLFAALQKKASESITIGSLPLRFIGCFLDDEDADSAAAKKLIAWI